MTYTAAIVVEAVGNMAKHGFLQKCYNFLFSLGLVRALGRSSPKLYPKAVRGGFAIHQTDQWEMPVGVDTLGQSSYIELQSFKQDTSSHEINT